MRIKNQSEFEALANTLLEAERAGVKVITELLELIINKDAAFNLLESFLMDEGLNCRILMNLLKKMELNVSDKTGDFVEKVRQLDNIDEKIKLLIKGQEWVAKKIHNNLGIIPEGSCLNFFTAIQLQHDENVSDLKKILTD